MKLNFKVILVGLLVLSLGLFSAGCGDKQTNQSGEKEKDLKVAFVYTGAKDDFGWATVQEKARKDLADMFPNVQFTAVENIPEGSDSARTFTQLCEQGYGLIIASSFGYQDAVQDVAKKYPDVKFIHCVGNKTADNVSIYFGKIYQLRYLSGILAGKITETNTIGHVAAFPVPACISGLNAFALGVQSVNPDAVIKVVWTNTWYDPATEKEAAKSLLDTGADIISMHQDTPQGLIAASERGCYGIGYDNDMTSFAPDHAITSLCWDWTKIFKDEVQAVLDGTWKSGRIFPGLEVEGFLQLAPYGPMVPDEAKQLVDEKMQLMASQEWDVFTGPIKDKDGNIRVEEGQKLTDDEIWSMDWIVGGIKE